MSLREALMGSELTWISPGTTFCWLSHCTRPCFTLMHHDLSLFQRGLTRALTARALTWAVVSPSIEWLTRREWKLPQHRNPFQEAPGCLSVAEGHWWVKDYDVRPLRSGHGGQLHYSMTTFHLVLSDLLNAAVAQVLAFLSRSHTGRLQILPGVQLSEDCAYLNLGVWQGGERHHLNRVVQSTRKLFSKLLNVGTSCEEWFSWILCFLP